MSEQPRAMLFERNGSWRTVPYILFAVVFGIAGICGLVGTLRGLAVHGLKDAQPVGIVLAPFFVVFLLGIALLLTCRIALTQARRCGQFSFSIIVVRII
jgi:hypothetical protein